MQLVLPLDPERFDPLHAHFPFVHRLAEGDLPAHGQGGFGFQHQDAPEVGAVKPAGDPAGHLSCAPDADDHLAEGDFLAGSSQRLAGCRDDAAAAGNLHPQDGDPLQARGAKQLGQLLGIGPGVVQFRTGDHHGLAGQKIPMVVGIGERDAIGGDQQFRVLEVGGAGRHQHQLHRPLGQLARLRFALRLCCGRRGEGYGPRAGAALMSCRRRRRRGGFLMQMLFHGGFFEIIGVPLDDGDGIPGTIAQAGPQPVAQVVGGNLRLAAYDLYGALGARRDAKPAAVALLLVYLHDFSDHLLKLLPLG